MKKLVLTIAAVSALTTIAAPKPPAAPQRPKLNAMTQAERQAFVYARTGGFVSRPAEGKCLKIVNAADIGEETVAKLAEVFQKATGFPVKAVKGTADVSAALDRETGFALLLVKTDDPRLLLAPEDGWAKVNVRTLATDDAALYDARVRKEAWRGLVYGLGGGNTKFQQCIMKPILTVEELDANGALLACPEVYGTITETGSHYGMKANRPVTYLIACKQGWAPAPTNDVQKAIWDKVHATPQTPMKIEFDPKKGR